MPLYWIESTYHLPMFRQRVYTADTLEAACKAALDDDDWEGQQEDHETAGPTYVTDIRAGSEREGPELSIPITARSGEQVAFAILSHFAQRMLQLGFDDDHPVAGSDVVDYVAEMLPAVMALLDADSGPEEASQERDDDEALMPDGSRLPWDERLRTVGANRVPKAEP